MSIRRFLLIGLTILFVFNLYLGFELRSSHHKSINTLTELKGRIYYDSVNKVNAQKILKLQYSLEDNLGKLILNNDCVNDPINYVVVLYFERQCTSCLKEVVMNFSYLKEKTGYNNFVIIGMYKDSTFLKNTIQKLDNEFIHIYLKQGDLESQWMDNPVVFVLNPKAGIKYFYSSDLYPELKEWYYLTLLKEYCIKHKL